jgi:phosphatidylserine/phosphatidylglycerophosphate/cardiolipin synthase-like enzyme
MTPAGQLATLIDADGGGGRLLACTPVSPNEGQGNPVYVHAKIGIVDDRWLTVGSANLTEHSLFNDTEVNIVTLDPGPDSPPHLAARDFEALRSIAGSAPGGLTVDA